MILEDKNIHLPNARLLGVGVAFCVVLLFIVLQLVSDHDRLFGFSYWIIPDSVTNFKLTRGLVTGEFALQDFLASAAVPLYYSVFFELGIFGFIVANLILIAICMRYFGLRALFIPLLLYPHYLQLLVLPSKDMMVLAAYIAVMFYLINGKIVIPLLLSLATYFIRDGATFVLVPIIAAAYLLQYSRIKPLWLVIGAFICGLIMSVVLEELAGELFVVSRNLYALKEMSSDAVRELPLGIAYVAKVFFNLTNLAFRLPFIDEFGGISIASILMYISGVSSLVCCAFAAKYLVKSTAKNIQLISVCFFISLFIISLNPFIQGRYQLPMSIVASIILFRNIPLKSVAQMYGAVILISLVARFAYIYANIPIPELEVNPIDLLTLVYY